MTDAINAPIRRARRETSNADFPIGQKPDIVADEDGSFDREQVIVHARGDELNSNAMAELAFNEEPITILIHPSREKNPPLVVDCWVNGKGAEVFVNGKWHEFNCLPVDMPVITKRKYAENLANSKVDSIDTDVGDESMANPHNRIRRMTSSNVVFQVIEDRNPKGTEWLRRLSARNH
jgi:hypothetical protein